MELEQLLLLVAASVALFMAVAWWRASTRGSRRTRRRTRHAVRAEGAAEALLESLGFSILERQVAGSWAFEVDGEPVEASVRADLLVERDDRVYVAEVKTGERAPDPAWPQTRRQLLEYLLVFEPDGLLLVDMEARQVREVAFPELFG